jgi:serine/threonine-protein kinase
MTTPGALSHPRYRIGQEIGRGGTSRVFQAQDTQTGATVAFKQWDAPPTGSLRPLPMWRHPHLVNYLDGGSHDAGDFVVMELVLGQPAQKLFRESPLPPQATAAVFNQILDALAFAHEQDYLHGDIHPGNILLSPQGNGWSVKLLDFTLRQRAAPENAPLFGNIYTMAPERFEGKPVDARADLYSLGCTFYFMAHSHYPFTGETSVEVAQAHLRHLLANIESKPDLPTPCQALINALMARNPDARPATARDALALLSGP